MISRCTFPSLDEKNPIPGSEWLLPPPYRPIKPLGRGTYGEVMLCSISGTDEQVAIKKILNVFGTWEDGLGELREIRTMRHLQHPKIMNLKSILRPIKFEAPNIRIDFDYNELYMVMPYMPTCIETIIADPSVSQDHISWMVFQILEGLAYMHDCGVIHRDLKPENVLVDGSSTIKIIDFGLARKMNSAQSMSEMTGVVQTLWYRAPEILLGQCADLGETQYGTAVDVWSVGAILGELLSGNALFQGKTETNMISLIREVCPDPDYFWEPVDRKARLSRVSNSSTLGDKFNITDPTALDLLEGLLKIDPSVRLTAHQALEHPFFAQWQDFKSEHPPAEVMDFKHLHQAPPDRTGDPNRTWKELLRNMLWEDVYHFNQGDMPENRPTR
jgi:mitogen-activated protein kinase 1/3